MLSTTNRRKRGTAPRSWQAIPQLADSSGVGTYTTTATLSGRWSGAYLDLGAVGGAYRVAVNGRAQNAPQVEQIYFEVERRSKIEVLTRLIDLHDFRFGIIFCSTKVMVDELDDHLHARGYSTDRLHGDIASIWRGGCIIRAHFLNHITAAYRRSPDLKNLILDPYFRDIIGKSQAHWRYAIQTAVEFGVAVPAFSAALSYYDSYRSERLPANLLQAQRDYFGAHTYERIDKPAGEFFHTEWFA